MTRIAYEDIELGQVLGKGTVGTVYSGRIKPHWQHVAVKILHAEICEDELIRARFRREMQILQKLEHPHIIRYLGSGEHEGQLFLVMQVVDRGNVRDLLQRFGNLTWQEVASIGRQVCSALQHAHNHGIIHRDLKPGNLFLDSQANVRLGDFGIARDTNAEDLTAQGITVGTHAYMSPEQITGDPNLNGKADLYSLGCVLFELLTGSPPFQGVTVSEVLERQLHEPPARVTDWQPDCPPVLVETIDKLLKKSPDERPFSARAVQGILLELLSQPTVGDADDSHNHDRSQQENPLSLDAGMQSLMNKLQPDERSELSWRMLAMMAAAVMLIIWFASAMAR